MNATRGRTRLERFERRVAEVVATDFGGEQSAQARQVALDALAQLRSLTIPPRPKAAKRGLPKGARWITRSDIHIDRIASAWLVRRFVDGAAEFVFVGADEAKTLGPSEGSVRFDMFEAEFTHTADRCTFEVLADAVDNADAALRVIGEIVHDLDLGDQKFQRAETAGVASQIRGVCRTHREDLARIAAATPIFDALYCGFSEPLPR